MTQEELDQLAQQVTDKIQNKSSDPSQFELATSLQGIESLPVLHQSGGTWTLKRVLISLLKGSDGKQVELQVTATAIQWRYAGGAWVDLILLSTLLDPATDLMDELQEVIDLWNNTTKGQVSTAITNANTAATNADSKAGLANTAATNANTAASEANTAKEGVLDAIDNANDTAEHPTYIGTDFYVYKWNKTTKVYEKTDIFVKGSAGAGNVDIINSPTVKKDVPYVIVPTADAAQTYNAVEAAVGGRNLLRTYNSPDLFASSGGSVLTKSVVELTEFGITDANRIVSSGGTSITKAYISFGILSSGVKRVASVFVKNNSSKDLVVHPNFVTVSSPVILSPGELKLVSLRYIGNASAEAQIRFHAPTISDNIDVTWWRIMYEEGHIPSTPVPALEDYYDNGNLKGTNLIQTGVQKFDKPGIKIYKNVAENYSVPSQTGTIVIKLPVGWISGLYKFKIQVWGYTTIVGSSAKELSEFIITGNNSTSALWHDAYYVVLGGNLVSVRLGYKDNKCCILLGEATKQWGNYHRVVVSEIATSYSGASTDLSTGWTIELITDESEITNIVTPTLVSRTVAQSELDAKASTTQLNSAISDFNTRFAGQYEIVSVLPAVGVEGKMYLVTTGTSNVYNLFTWKSVSGVFDWVDLGSTTVDLSQYAKSADVTSALSNKVDKISGKGLSTNDYTNDEKSEVAKIANKADLGEDGKVLPSQLPAMSGGLGKPQEIKLLLSDAMPTSTYDGNHGFVWSLSTDGDSFVENCRFSLSCGYDAMPPSAWSIYVEDDGIAYLNVSFVEEPFAEYLILDRYTGFSNSAAPISAPSPELWSNTHIAQNTGGVDASIGGMFTLTASGALKVSFINLYYIPLGKSLRIRIKGNNSTNRTITITPDGVTNELDNTSYKVNKVKTLELDIVNFGGEFIMKGVLYE